MRKPGVMLILTPWLAKDTIKNRALLARELGVSPSDMEIATFPVSGNWTGVEWEFAVIGFLVTPSP
jgi:hypothetical protein